MRVEKEFKQRRSASREGVRVEKECEKITESKEGVRVEKECR